MQNRGKTGYLTMEALRLSQGQPGYLAQESLRDSPFMQQCYDMWCEMWPGMHWQALMFEHRLCIIVYA